jgi:hypothetical protein
MPHTDDGSGDAGRSPQPSLPLDFDQPLDQPLDHDAPVPFRLTPRARRAVATDPGPELRVVTDQEPIDPHDPRRARARALRRAGRSIEQVAAALDLEPTLVHAWTTDLGRPKPRGRHLRAVTEPRVADQLDPRRTDFERLAEQAQEDARERLGSAQFVRGLALVVASAEISLHGALVGVQDRATAKRIVAWLLQTAGVDSTRLRAIVRTERTGADLAAHRWADDLGLPREQVAVTTTGSSDGHVVLLRIASSEVAARLLGWRRALLAAEDLDLDPVDLAF